MSEPEYCPKGTYIMDSNKKCYFVIETCFFSGRTSHLVDDGKIYPCSHGDVMNSLGINKEDLLKHPSGNITEESLLKFVIGESG